jgi:hypothetical protein
MDAAATVSTTGFGQVLEYVQSRVSEANGRRIGKYLKLAG